MIFTIEGNIGSGKTTILRDINQFCKFDKKHVVIYEQVQEWAQMKDENNIDILSLFYKDKTKYSYIFQSYVLFSRINHMLETVKNNPGAIIICERSHFTDLYVFALALYESKDISEIEWKVYNEWHRKLRELLSITISGIVYIKTDAEMCHQRMKIRNRNGEEGVPLDYLKILEVKHDKWLLERPVLDTTKKWFSVNKDTIIPVLTLNGNIDVYDINNRERQYRMIEEFINTEIKSA
uniref:Deoxynucleoside kinase domain-containing protein n=1 Tax=viral metagenome TaxID=1070528 RepID=A0A6C0HD10_9ZZZZ